MEAWSVSPVRVAAVLVVADGAPQARAELRVVGRISLVVRDAPVGSPTVEVAATQSLPDGEDLDFLDPGDADFTLPPNGKAARRIAGQHLADGTLFAFRGAPEPLAKLRMPKLQPRLFLTSSAALATTSAAREATWTLGNVSLDVVDRTISMSFRARVPSRDDGADLAIVSLDSDRAQDDGRGAEDGRSGFGALLAATRRLDPAFVQQRARVEPRNGGIESLGAPPGEASPRSGPVAVRAILEEETASMGAAELDAAVATARIDVRPAPFVALERRSIGEILSLDAQRARPPVALTAPAPEPDAELSLERIFSAPEAGALVRRRFPEVVKPLKRSQDVEAQDRRAVAVAARAAPRSAIGALPQALAGALDDGLLAPEHAVVVSAELVLALDPGPALRALLTAAGPFARAGQLPHDARKALVEVVDEAMAKVAMPAAPALARLDQDLAALRERFARILGVAASRDLEDAAFARLIAARRVLEVSILGEPHAVLYAEGVPVYVPAASRSALPLMPSFRGRIIGAPRPRYDELEASPVALVALALFREVAV